MTENKPGHCPGCGNFGRLPILYKSDTQEMRVCGVLCWNKNFVKIFGNLEDMRVTHLSGDKLGGISMHFDGREFEIKAGETVTVDGPEIIAIDGREHTKQTSEFSAYGPAAGPECFGGEDFPFVEPDVLLREPWPPEFYNLADPTPAPDHYVTRERAKQRGRERGREIVDAIKDSFVCGPYEMDPDRVFTPADFFDRPEEVAAAFNSTKLNLKTPDVFPIPEGYRMLRTWTEYENPEYIEPGDMVYNLETRQFVNIQDTDIGHDAGRFVCAIRRYDERFRAIRDTPGTAPFSHTIPGEVYEAMRAVAAAWNVPGPGAYLHRQAQMKLTTEWRTLANAVAKLADYYKK